MAWTGILDLLRIVLLHQRSTLSFLTPSLTLTAKWHLHYLEPKVTSSLPWPSSNILTLTLTFDIMFLPATNISTYFRHLLVRVDTRLYKVNTPDCCIWKVWEDYNLAWTPSEYGGLDRLEVPVKAIWTPEIVLFNKWVTWAGQTKTSKWASNWIFLHAYIYVDIDDFVHENFMRC